MASVRRADRNISLDEELATVTADRVTLHLGVPLVRRLMHIAGAYDQSLADFCVDRLAGVPLPLLGPTPGEDSARELRAALDLAETTIRQLRAELQATEQRVAQRDVMIARLTDEIAASSGGRRWRAVVQRKRGRPALILTGAAGESYAAVLDRARALILTKWQARLGKRYAAKAAEPDLAYLTLVPVSDDD